MLNLKELRKLEWYGRWRHMPSNHFRHLLDIAEAAKRHSESFRNAHGVLVVGPREKQIEVNEAAMRLDKLLEDVEVGNA